MTKNLFVQPFLKWAGGKRQLLPEIRKYIPKTFKNYYEAFIGGGAVFFDLQPKKAVINDINFDLYNCYCVIRDNVNELIKELEKYQNSEEAYYQVRDWDRSEDYQNLSPVQRASRIIYLNKTCYNGLFRVNSQGQFNVPFGRYKNPKIINKDVLLAVSAYLKKNQVEIRNMDFEKALEDAQKGDFVYLDPPYDPVSETASFTGYSMDGFNRNEQKRLKEVVDSLDKRGCKVLLSNSATPFITDLYKDYTIVKVSASRNINSVASGRGKIDEVLVMNYGNKK